MENLYNYIQNCPVFDSHEHLVRDDFRTQMFPDFFSMIMQHYLSGDCISAGMTKEEHTFMQKENPLAEKWEIFKRVRPHVQHTVYFKAVDIAFRDLYHLSLSQADDTTYMLLQEAFEKTRYDGYTNDVLKQCKIMHAVNEVFVPSMQAFDFKMDQTIHKPSARCDIFMMLHQSLADVEHLYADHPFVCLDEVETALERYVSWQKNENGCIALKVGVAYERNLTFVNESKQDAQNALDAILKATRSNQTLPQSEMEPFQNYMAHCIMKMAEKYQLPLQIHAGMQEGSGNVLANSNPLQLNNLFLQYPNVRFDLFHLGFPYAREAGVFAKMFANVYVDFAWAHILSPLYAIQMLDEYLDFIPSNKIIGFGGDYFFVEGTYGHLAIAKENIYTALRQKVERNTLTETQAMEIADKLLYKNALAFFALEQ